MAEKLEIYFDGYCRFCSRFARFVDSRLQAEAQFAPLDSDGAPETGSDSIVVVSGGRTLTESAAVAEILFNMPQPWRLLGRLLKLVPSIVADPFYRIFSSLRYRLFGRRESQFGGS